MGRGRPRKTDPEAVLDKAMRLFWEKGFDGTSMSDLVSVTGMAKPGLYNTFGDKEALYAKTLTHYVADYGESSFHDLIHARLPLEKAVRVFFDDVVAMLVDKTNPGGCFLANTLIDCTKHSSELDALALKYNGERLSAFVERFQRAQAQGELPAGADAETLAEFFSGQSLALSVMGRAGADKQTLDRFVDVAMTALPHTQN
ncbi:MAG: TetR/AcrR family transcriptional regulator [Sneathiella sp.]|nr:TetR/AcrR family transcriptional regulator [Sneathiella sp.]